MTDTAYSQLRYAIAAALEGETPSPPEAVVLPDVPDAVSPPAYLIVWGNPWLEPATYCAHVARVDVICVAGRMDPAPGIDMIEQMISTAIIRLREARFPEVIVQPPARFDIGGVAYLAARLSLETRLQVQPPVYVAPGVFDDPSVLFDSVSMSFDGVPI